MIVPILWIISGATVFALIICMMGLAMVSESLKSVLLYPGNLGSQIIGVAVLWQFAALPALLGVIALIRYLSRRD